jgi:ABC-type tungstate transport system permease subunit
MLINRGTMPLPLNPEKYPQANCELAKRFVEFLENDCGQKVINPYGEKELGCHSIFRHHIGFTSKVNHVTHLLLNRPF